MKRSWYLVALLVFVAAFALVVPVSAAAQPPVGGCPSGYELHEYMHMGDMEMEHMHAGLKVDLNGDGFICMKPVSPDSSIHVHVDNTVLP